MNTYGQPVPTKHQAVEYCCKYCGKHTKRSGTRSALFDLMDDMSRKDAGAKEKYGDDFEESKLGPKIHRAFMAEVGEEMSQCEIAHHANRCPEYFCSRPEKQVHLYKQALSLDTEEKTAKSKAWTSKHVADEEWLQMAEDAEVAPGTSVERGIASRKARATKPSDLELYERRSSYCFPAGTALSPYLPPAATPEEQVARASVYEFFRLVQFHGGRTTRLTWHSADALPVVTMSPVVSLREGPDFAFGARWALVQYHPWVDRREFLDLDDEAVKDRFRCWEQAPHCPWYVKEQYIEDSSRQLRGVKGTQKPSQAAAQPSGQPEPTVEQAYEARLQAFIGAGDYDAAAALQAQLQAYEASIKQLLERSYYAGAAALQQKILGEFQSEPAPGPQVHAPSEDEDLPLPEAVSETEESSDEAPEPSKETLVLKMLYSGNIMELNRQDEQQRRGKIFNHRHDFYKKTRCTSTAQEAQSAMPGGVINVHEDSDDGEEFFGEQKEIAKEMQELHAAQHWVNQAGWDAAGEGRAVSPSTGEELDLRLPWDSVKKQLAQGADVEVAPSTSVEASEQKYDLDDLDPTQRVFADRVLKWAAEVVRVYKGVSSTGVKTPIPKLRSWLGGSAGSGKSTTLKTIVQHIRLLFQREAVNATVELTAYTGVAAFNIGFGAKTACSSFRVFPKAAWKNELAGAAARQLEEQWRNVVLLIVDEISFIGRAFFARMHFRTQQAKRSFFSEAALDPNVYTFGDLSIILVCDFGQLEPIDDWSMCDSEASFQTCPKNMRHLWRHACQGKLLL